MWVPRGWESVSTTTQLELELFDVVPPPAAFCDEEELDERFINSVNVAADDMDGDNMIGHHNEKLKTLKKKHVNVA